MVLGKWNIHVRKSDTRPLPYTIHKKELKVYHRPKCKSYI